MVVAGVTAIAVAPAATAQTQYLKPLAWYAEQTTVPQTVEFHDVAAQGEFAAAVGRDGDAETGIAAVYTRTDGEWAPGTIDQTVTAPSDLTDVAVQGTEAWAVGSAGTQPLVLRLVNGEWEPQASPLTKPATSVAIDGTKVLVGDAAGDIHTLDTAGGDATSDEALAAGAINDIAVNGASSGFAVADFAPLPVPSPVFGERSVRIYELGPEPQPDPEAQAASAEVDMLSVASTSPVAAVAADSTGATWRFNSEAWVQESALGAQRLGGVAQLAERGSDGSQTGYVWEAVAGTVAAPDEPAPGGAIWQRYRWRSHDFAWQRQTLPAGTRPLTAVTLPAPEAGWAVGHGGTILRYWRPPDPEAERAAAEKAEADRIAAEQAAAEQAAAEQAEAERAAAEQAAAEQAAAEQAAAEQAAAEQAAQEEQAPAEEPAAEEAPPPPPPPPPPAEQDDIRTNGIVIDDSPAEPRDDGSKPTQRLLKDVKAVRRGRKLIVSFRLTARARVAIVAKRGRRVVGRAPMRTLRKGRRTIVLRFGGKPPSSLKVVVRRASGASNSNR